MTAHQKVAVAAETRQENVGRRSRNGFHVNNNNNRDKNPTPHPTAPLLAFLPENYFEAK